MQCERFQITDIARCPALGTRGNNRGSEQSYKVTVKPKTSSEADDKSPSGKAKASEYSSNSDVRISPSGNSDEQNIGFGMFLGVFLPILLISCLALWIFYAYRNPHTKSGQLLIQVNFFVYLSYYL